MTWDYLQKSWNFSVIILRKNIFSYANYLYLRNVKYCKQVCFGDFTFEGKGEEWKALGSLSKTNEG